MNEKEFSKLYWLEKEHQILEKELTQLEGMLDYRSPVLSGLPKSTALKDTADFIAEITDLKTAILKKLTEIYRERKRIESFVDSVYDPELRVILRMRHMKGLTWEEIGDEIHMTKSGVYRKYKRYIDKLSS